jgi:hypothetical protein
VGEIADDNILTKQYFPRAHTEEIRELETGLMVTKANNSQQLGGRERLADNWALKTLVVRQR